jgi:RNA polymerase sigma factor (sigma-70 family)
LKIVSCKLNIEVLLDNHRRFLSFLEARVGDRAIAEDIIQDAFVRNLSKIEALPEAALVPWFYTALRNAAIDRHRRQEVESRRLDQFARELARAESAPADLAREICACVARLAETLKPEYADALTRIDVEGTPVKDYAAAEGMTPNNASVRVHRARQALRKRVIESCGMCAEHGCVDCTCSASGSGGPPAL